MNKLPLVFMACKYTEPTTYQIQYNIHRATYFAHEVAKLGAVPLCPALIGANFEGLQTYEWWCDAYLSVLAVSDIVFMVPGWENSKGAKHELQKALELGKPVFYTLDSLKKWIDSLK